MDQRPTEYDKVVGSFDEYKYKSRQGRHGTRTAKLKITQHPSWFHLEANGKSYDKIAKFFETVPVQSQVTLLLEKGIILDKEHSHIVYQIIVNDAIIFDRLRDDAIISDSINLIR